jgi:hypothetical protein
MRVQNRRTAGVSRRSLILAASLALPLGACATLHPISSERAVDVARRSVCGAPGGAGDAACTVRSTSKIRGGYRVFVDRRPPAGNDHLAVEVRGGGGQIEVFPLDSASTAPRR